MVFAREPAGWCACVIVLTLALPVGAASARDFRGAIGGRVIDESGAVLPGVCATPSTP